MNSEHDGVCVCLYFRFTSTQDEKPIGTANCPSPRSYKKVRGGRAVFPARGWSCLLCCASRPVTTWPSSSTAAQILPGSSLTAWLTVMVGVMALLIFGFVMTSNWSLKQSCFQDMHRIITGENILQHLVTQIESQKFCNRLYSLITTPNKHTVNYCLHVGPKLEFVRIYCIVRLTLWLFFLWH